MALTAAWSAAFSSPRPIRREAASAAASVTRTVSSARLRSIALPWLLWGLLEELPVRLLADFLAFGIGSSSGWRLKPVARARG